MEYRFTLQKYKPGSKTTCPQCGKTRSFVRYVDRLNEITLPDYVGRCDREDKCGYHYTPKQYFQEHPSGKCPPIIESDWKIKLQKTKSLIKKPSLMDNKIMLASQKCFDQNYFYLFLVSMMGKRETDRLFYMYKVGTSKYWKGSTVFWQIDINQRVHAGKVFLYNKENGHRVKEDGFAKINWVHKLLKLSDFNLNQCLFGEHLLSRFPSSPIMIVESEKTAIISSHYMPGYIWLATGGKDGCFNSKAMQVLKGRDVMLMPDLKATEHWIRKSAILKGLCKSVKVCNVLEQIATPRQREEGLDLADFLIT